MKPPLEGVKIVELAQWLAMPAAMAILADWGAEVIKIENVQGGDALRHLKPMVEVPRKTINAWWEQTNRNKKGHRH